MLGWDYNSLGMMMRSLIAEIIVFSYKNKGNFFRKIKNYDKAADIFSTAALDTGKTEFFYSEAADIFLKSGNYSRAVEFYKTAIEEAPDNSALWARLAILLQKYFSDNIDDLKICYTRLAELQPGNSRVFYELGHIYLKQNDKFSSINAFKRAVELDPKNPYYHNSLAYSLVQLEDYEASISEYQKAIRLNPDSSWTSIVSQALGSIYHQIYNNIDAAIVAYQNAVVLDPVNVDAYIVLGEIYYEKNDLNNAIENFLEAIKIDPTIAKVYCNLGLALWESNYIEESIISYQKAIALDTKYYIAFNNLGVVYLDGLREI